MKKGISFLFVAFLVGALLVAGSASAADMKTFKVRVHSQMPAGHYVTKAVDLFIEEANKLSNNTLQFTHFPSQQLYKDSEMPGVLPKGGVEMAEINGSMFIGKVPVIGIGSQPAAFDNLDHFYRYYYDYQNSKAMVLMADGYEKQSNIISLGSLLYSPNNAIMTTKPIIKLEDFKGKKIRGWGKTLTAILEKWGAAGVVMSSSDVYMAMERGTIDGVFSGMTSFWARKWFEPAKYVNVIDGFLPSPFTLAANLDFWNGLHPDQQRALIDAAHTAEVWCIKAAIQGWEDAQKGLESKGVQIHVWSPEDAKVLREEARIAIFDDLVTKPLGEEMANNVKKWIEVTRTSTMTWEEACAKNKERLLSRVK